ncbi:unnamed protein product [Adineta steineri]|uniref:Homeobox domain-containing protein n=1 Tax=Adineta steineri TaxID=433720 RepID=A0A819V5D9_9BILA|nr:unnamed protein product [Adineta steineri]
MATVTSNDEQNQPTNESKIKHQRCRRTFTFYQIVELEKVFSYTKYPTNRERCELARRSGLNERQVRIWFLNRRMKWVKENTIGSRYYPAVAA